MLKNLLFFSFIFGVVTMFAMEENKSQALAGKTFTIPLRKWDKTIHTVGEINQTSTILDLKKFLQTKDGVSVEHQELVAVTSSIWTLWQESPLKLEDQEKIADVVRKHSPKLFDWGLNSAGQHARRIVGHTEAMPPWVYSKMQYYDKNHNLLVGGIGAGSAHTKQADPGNS